MLFITNREPKGSIKKGKKDQPYDFDLNRNSPSISVFFCRRNTRGDYTEIGGAKLMNLIQKSKVKQIVLYIHGFSNLPEPHIFPRAEKLQSLFDEKEKNLVTVLPLIWPCDNDAGIVQDYWDDQPEQEPCLKRINTLAHSMGTGYSAKH